MGALFARLKTGKGQHIEVSAQECITSILEMTFDHLAVHEHADRPLGPAPDPPDRHVPVQGRRLDLRPLRSRSTSGRRLVELMETPEWTTWEVAANRFVRASNWDALRPFMEEWVSQWNTDDLYRAAQAKRIPFAPASTLGRPPGLRAPEGPRLLRRSRPPEAGKITRSPARRYELSETPWEIRSPAPTLGQHNDEVLGDARALPDESSPSTEARVV